jgi:hypothetical protein
MLGPVQVVNTAPPNVKIAVLPSEDERPTLNRAGTMFMYLLPLCPIGWVTYERPEASQMFMSIREYRMDAREDLSKAIAMHLEKAGVAKTVFFDQGGLAGQADYVLTPRVSETKYKGKIYSYGISVLCPYLWLLGLPAGSSKVDLSLDLLLRGKDGQDIWKATVTGQTSLLQGFYYGWGRDMEGLSQEVQRGLERELRKNPPKL